MNPIDTRILEDFEEEEIDDRRENWSVPEPQVIVRFTMYFCSEFMEICKPIHFWKAYNARSPKNNV